MSPSHSDRAAARRGSPSCNVGRLERIASTALGGALAGYGLMRRSKPGGGLAVLGGLLLYRGTTGHCPVYSTLGIGGQRRSSRDVLSGSGGINVRTAVTINKPLEEVYAFWRNLENLPRFMRHLREVRVTGPSRSHWVASAPAGGSVEWDAEIINEVPTKVIGWRSLEGSEVVNAGSVNFDAAGDRGTAVAVNLQYEPPAGKAGATVARLFGRSPERQIEEDLRRMKALLETGEVPTTEGQPRGRQGVIARLFGGRSRRRPQAARVAAGRPAYANS